MRYSTDHQYRVLVGCL